jgi:hypothetical protein
MITSFKKAPCQYPDGASGVVAHFAAYAGNAVCGFMPRKNKKIK